MSILLTVVLLLINSLSVTVQHNYMSLYNIIVIYVCMYLYTYCVICIKLCYDLIRNLAWFQLLQCIYNWPVLKLFGWICNCSERINWYCMNWGWPRFKPGWPTLKPGHLRVLNQLNQVVNQVNPVQPSLKPWASCKAGHSSSAQFRQVGSVLSMSTQFYIDSTQFIPDWPSWN